MPRQKLERVQVAFLSMEILLFSFRMASRGWRAPCWRTKSRQVGESPAIFPSAQTACSRTSGTGDERRTTK